jgi:hypothetical protein
MNGGDDYRSILSVEGDDDEKSDVATRGKVKRDQAERDLGEVHPVDEVGMGTLFCGKGSYHIEYDRSRRIHGDGFPSFQHRALKTLADMNYHRASSVVSEAIARRHDAAATDD